MDAVEVSTVVYVPAEEAYEFLLDFPGYARYSKHLKEVRRHGDGTPGTRYDITFTWWKLSYTARSEVTDVEPPTRIDWRLVKDIDAGGYWGIEPLPGEAPDGGDACRVRLHIEFRPGSANRDSLNLPAFVSFDWVVDKVKPKVETEAERICRRVVRDLEGQDRPVDLEIHQTADTI